MSSEATKVSEPQLLEVCDAVTIDTQEIQVEHDGFTVNESSNPGGACFPFGSSSVISNNTEPVYLMFESSTEANQSFGYENAKGSPVSRKIEKKLESYHSKTDVFSTLEDKAIAGRSRTGETKCLEPGCNFVCSRIPKLRTHLEEVHGIQQERKMFAFSSEDEFKTWLSAVQREARCTYMRRRGWQANKNGSITACYYCHRGGAYTSKATKKQVKQQGSCKTGVECTSSMKVTIWTLLESKTEDPINDEAKHVQVEAYLQHYGHNLDLNHTRITPLERDDIARKLSSGMSRNKIMDEIRGTLDTTMTPHRLHLISLQDLYNIEKREGIKSQRKKQSNDEGTTVQAWIQKMQRTEDNPVLLIKYQQEKATEACSCLSDDDFILILQTPLQAKMLRRHGPHQCICMDITQGDETSGGTKNDPNFYLMSLEVLIPSPGNKDDVFPVAWFVSNRKDRSVVEIFLKQVKNNLSDLTLTPSNLLLPCNSITGGCDWFAIWVSIFGSGPRKLLCGWHVMNEWKQRVHRTAAKNASFEATRFLSNLRVVLQAPSLERFMKHVQDFVDQISKDEACIAYAKYFKLNYMEKPETWARAYRSEPQVSAESLFEDYHAKISRHIYQEGFKRKQLDVLIKTLMRHSRDKALNKLRQSYKLTSDAAIKRMTSSNHWDSINLPVNFVSPHQDSHTWSVMSVIDSVRAVEQPLQSGQPMRLKKVAVEYIVTCTDVDRCPARMMCAYRCDECGICSHHFTCSCQNEQKNNSIPGEGLQVLCEHCHLVLRFMRKNNLTAESLFSAPTTAQASEQDEDVNDSSQKIIVMVVEDDTDSVLTEPNETETGKESSTATPADEVADCAIEEAAHPTDGKAVSDKTLYTFPLSNESRMETSGLQLRMQTSDSPASINSVKLDCVTQRSLVSDVNDIPIATVDKTKHQKHNLRSGHPNMSSKLNRIHLKHKLTCTGIQSKTTDSNKKRFNLRKTLS